MRASPGGWHVHAQSHEVHEVHEVSVGPGISERNQRVLQHGAETNDRGAARALAQLFATENWEDRRTRQGGAVLSLEPDLGAQGLPKWGQHGAISVTAIQRGAPWAVTCLQSRGRRLASAGMVVALSTAVRPAEQNTVQAQAELTSRWAVVIGFCGGSPDWLSLFLETACLARSCTRGNLQLVASNLVPASRAPTPAKSTVDPCFMTRRSLLCC